MLILIIKKVNIIYFFCLVKKEQEFLPSLFKKIDCFGLCPNQCLEKYIVYILPYFTNFFQIKA